MWSLRSPRLRRGIYCRTRSSRQFLCSTPLQWSLPDLLLGICRCLSRILRPRPRLLNLDDRDLLAPQAVEQWFLNFFASRPPSVFCCCLAPPICIMYGSHAIILEKFTKLYKIYSIYVYTILLCFLFFSTLHINRESFINKIWSQNGGKFLTG